jgi:hypothetical protein
MKVIPLLVGDCFFTTRAAPQSRAVLAETNICLYNYHDAPIFCSIALQTNVWTNVSIGRYAPLIDV